MADPGMPLVSIGIPTFNRADTYLRTALRSAVGQSYTDIEVIVADNCSVDATAQLVAEFSDPRIRYFRHPVNVGANRNFNFCLEQARGDYFLLLQDDDWVDLDFVEVCLRAGGFRRDIGVVRTGTRVVDARGAVLAEVANSVGGRPVDEFFLGWFRHETALYLCSTLFNTGRLRAIGGFASKHALFQDAMAIVQLAAHHDRVDVRDVKANFRKHTAEMTFAARVEDWCEDSLLLLDLMCRLVPNNPLIRPEGMRFFSGINYGRAAAIRPSLRRLQAFWLVFRRFGYRHVPSRGHVYRLLAGPELYDRLRLFKSGSGRLSGRPILGRLTRTRRRTPGGTSAADTMARR